MIINCIYKLLNATIGSNLEALFAGKTPKIKPIDPEMIIVEKVVVIPTDVNSARSYVVIGPDLKAEFFKDQSSSLGKKSELKTIHMKS